MPVGRQDRRVRCQMDCKSRDARWVVIEKDDRFASRRFVLHRDMMLGGCWVDVDGYTKQMKKKKDADV